ncbi:MAG TPA: biotin synthase BioB [Gammaproteobacteria bacterium]|nr:biotin synthase BioB [Gammaproteobacteria bacterium]
MKKKHWTFKTVEKLFNLPFLNLLLKAQRVHRKYFRTGEIELGSLLNIKTGACPEDCAYCTQSGHYQTGLQQEKLFDLEKIVQQAKIAKEHGAMRFCMGAAWRSPPAKDFPKVIEIIKAVNALGLETCMTLGMLTEQQASELKEANLDFYNHNLDTSPNHYPKIISTRTYQDRLDTLNKVRTAGIKVCSGGIIGLGETREDRIELLRQLAHLPKPPESVPINKLIPMAGTPLANMHALDNIEFIRTIAVARILMPQSIVRLSAGRSEMSEEMQALCIMAGANSLWLGEKLLTAENPDQVGDYALFNKLGISIAKQLSC